MRLAYRTDEGRPWVLPVVRNVEMAMASDETLNHEYLAIDGLRQYSDAASRLLLGQDSQAVLHNRVSLRRQVYCFGFIIDKVILIITVEPALTMRLWSGVMCVICFTFSR